MTSRDDPFYYRRRLRQEEQAARQASCEAARERHEELASAYRLRLRGALLGDLSSQWREKRLAAEGRKPMPAPKEISEPILPHSLTISS